MKKLKINKNDFKFSQDSEPAEEPPYVSFDVPGAGTIRLSADCHSRCGGAVGFSFGVSWTSSMFIGGVLGRTEARRLAAFILKKCDEVTETEDQEQARIEKEISAMLK